MPTNWLKSLIQLDLSVVPYSPKYGGITEGKLLLSHCGKCHCKTGDITLSIHGFWPWDHGSSKRRYACMEDTEEFKSFLSMKNSSSRAEWCVCLNGFWASWGIFYLDTHFKSWNLVQEVVSEAVLNYIVNTDSSCKKNLQASLACFSMEATVISVCVHIFSQKKTGPRE